MLREADAVVVLPHLPARRLPRRPGERAARLLLRILDDGARPVTARVTIPALVRGEELITETGLVRAASPGAPPPSRPSPGGLAAGILISNPFTDVPELTTSAFVTTDGDPERAAAEALDLARGFWAVHDGDGPAAHLARRGGRGREGDARRHDHPDRRRRRDQLGRVRGQQRRPSRARRGRLPRHGARADRRRAGGRGGDRGRGRRHGPDDDRRPGAIPAGSRRCRSRAWSRRSATAATGANRTGWSARPARPPSCAAASITIVATSRPVMLHDRSLFLAHGLDPRAFDAVVVKSPRCEPHLFDDWAARTVHIDAPGSTSANLRSLGHTRCPRPIFPLDDDVAFEPVVELYSRPRYGVVTGRREDRRVRIREIRAVGLYGATPEGGWSHELRPEDSVHTLVAVVTEEGPVGYGSRVHQRRSRPGRARPARAALPRRVRHRTRADQRDPPPEHLLARARRDADPRHQRDRHRALGPPRPGDRPAGRAGCSAGATASASGRTPRSSCASPTRSPPSSNACWPRGSARSSSAGVRSGA